MFREFFFKLNKKFSPFNKRILSINEPKNPIMSTSYPGPNMKNLINDIELLNPDYLKINNFINYEKSSGNYFVDCDGNIFLDFSNSGNTNILGYNSKILFEKFLKNQNLFYSSFINKTEYFTNYFDVQSLSLLEETIKEVIPTAMEKVIFSTNPEELAYILSMTRRGNIQIEDNSTVNINYDNSVDSTSNDFLRSILPHVNYSKKNFSNKYKILKVTSNPLKNKDNYVTMNFQENKLFEFCSFPKLIYPLKENMKENYKIENKCLEEAEKILKAKFDFSAIIVDAVAEGDRWATPSYFSKLRKLASLYNLDFIVDERKTGLTVGRNWQHELWNLHLPPDFVIFGNKIMNEGLFIRNDALSDKIYNFFSGYSNIDFNNLIVLKDVLKVIKENNYLEKSEKAGEYFKLQLKELNKRVNLFTNIRGKASLISFDVFDLNYADNHEIQKLIYKKFLHFCRNSGIFIEGDETTNTIFIRPNAIINNNHYDKLLDTLEDFKKL